ncbi:hypothetical protein LINGRAHAP2_LOCUS5169 [Linum grandiflorum]
MSTSNQNLNWSILKDKALCEAWVEISEDWIIGNGQTSVDFWDIVKVIFGSKAFGPEHPDSGLSTRWRVIKAQYGAWNAALRKANTTPTSGSNLSDVVSEVLHLLPLLKNMYRDYTYLNN